MHCICVLLCVCVCMYVCQTERDKRGKTMKNGRCILGEPCRKPFGQIGTEGKLSQRVCRSPQLIYAHMKLTHDKW